MFSTIYETFWKIVGKFSVIVKQEITKYLCLEVVESVLFQCLNLKWDYCRLKENLSRYVDITSESLRIRRNAQNSISFTISF